MITAGEAVWTTVAAEGRSHSGRRDGRGRGCGCRHEQLDALMQGKTTIAIAHRLSTIARLDRLIVLDEGRIVEDGSHEELLRADGLYAGLWKRQSGGFLGADA